MRSILITMGAALATGCPAPTRAEDTTPPGCAYGYDAKTEDCRPNPNAIVQVQPPRRIHTVETEKAIDGYDVAAIPAGATGWRIGITNHGDAVAQVLLDESTFVASSGESLGRLISGDTRKIDTAKAQPPLPIAPGATIKQFVLPEKLIDMEEFEAKLQREGIPAKFTAELDQVRAKRYSLIVGGRLYLTVQSASGKQTWSGLVVMPAAGSE